MLAKVVNENHTDWDRHLGMLLLAYRSAIQESTKYSPAQMLYGRELRLPVDICFGVPVHEDVHPIPYVQALKEHMEKVHESARENLQLAHRS